MPSHTSVAIRAAGQPTRQTPEACGAARFQRLPCRTGLDLPAESPALGINRFPDIDHFRHIERLAEARSIPLDLRDFTSVYAPVTLKSCSVFLQRMFPFHGYWPVPPSIAGFEFRGGRHGTVFVFLAVIIP